MTLALERAFWSSREKTDNYIGQRVVRPIRVNRYLKTACGRANVPVITFHALRHTYATLALNAGVSIRTVSEILGHASVKTTIDVYWNHLEQKIDLGFLE